MTDRDYRTALYCENGHLITGSLEFSDLRINNCLQCGSRTMSKCKHCASRILGDHQRPLFSGIDRAVRANFCYNCGNLYPWTENHLRAARELIELTSLTESDKEELKKSMTESTTD